MAATVETREMESALPVEKSTPVRPKSAPAKKKTVSTVL